MVCYFNGAFYSRKSHSQRSNHMKNFLTCFVYLRQKKSIEWKGEKLISTRFLIWSWLAIIYGRVNWKWFLSMIQTVVQETWIFFSFLFRNYREKFRRKIEVLKSSQMRKTRVIFLSSFEILRSGVQRLLSCKS